MFGFVNKLKNSEYRKTYKRKAYRGIWNMNSGMQWRDTVNVILVKKVPG